MGPANDTEPVPLSPGQGRACIVVAAILWSTSSLFAKVLTQKTGLHLHEPGLDAKAIAFYRVLFAGLVLLPLLRPRDISVRPLMLGMVGSFAFMNATFVAALVLGSAANAIFLQYTAPLWVFLIGVRWMGEPADRRGVAALRVVLVGIGLIVVGGWREAQLAVTGLGLCSGLGYAGVLLFLRLLRNASSRWLTVLNHLGSALVLLPLVWSLPLPSWEQLAVLCVFGGLQMAVPYWLVARGLRSVSTQEAGMITLLEPLLMPGWAYLVSGEVPSAWTVAGGALILGALAWRYWPRAR